jgi:hypothetical protein
VKIEGNLDSRFEPVVDAFRDGSFSHSAAGGSMAFHDSARQIGFFLATDQMQEGLILVGTSALKTANALYDHP